MSNISRLVQATWNMEIGCFQPNHLLINGVQYQGSAEIRNSNAIRMGNGEMKAFQFVLFVHYIVVTKPKLTSTNNIVTAEMENYD